VHLSQITPAIFSGLGLSTAEDLIACGASPSGRELLFLIDGFGADVLETYGSYIPKISHLVRHGLVKTSFPSTTATSLATLMTGQLPGTHGMLGYTVQVPRSGGRILNSLKWDERVDPVMWQPIPTLFERAVAENINVTHVAAKRYENTGFTQAVFRGAKYSGANISTDLVGQTVEALQKSPSFVYLYVNDLDSAGHSDGVGSDKWIAALVAIDLLVSSLLHKLPRGTRLWITADHGMINVGEKIIIGQDNDLDRDIAVIAGEPRARHLYLAPENISIAARNEVAHRWRESLGNRAMVYTREEAKLAHLFGEEVTEDASDRMGDVVVVAQGGLVLLEMGRAEKEGAMVGHHGGVTDQESFVPLLTTTIN
jgi:hypothetical protein